jgi:hypothetical protein
LGKDISGTGEIKHDHEPTKSYVWLILGVLVVIIIALVLVVLVIVVLVLVIVVLKRSVTTLLFRAGTVGDILHHSSGIFVCRVGDNIVYDKKGVVRLGGKTAVETM